MKSFEYEPFHTRPAYTPTSDDGPLWASYQIRKIAGCACAGNAGNVSPRRRFQRKPLVSDPGMHHGTCVTHVPWCMSESFTCVDGENVPGIPGACAPAILRIWKEAHSVSGWTFYHKISKPRDWLLQLSHRSGIWQAFRQRSCQCVCQISKRLQKFKSKSRGLDTSRDLAVKRPSTYWIEAQNI